jgi:hypothetical protein
VGPGGSGVEYGGAVLDPYPNLPGTLDTPSPAALTPDG